MLNGGAMETERADFLVRGAMVYNSYFKKFVPADVSVSGGKFLYIDSRRSGAVEADETVDAEGLYMVPGLIDIHMHIESSMLTPGAFCRRLAECGVTTIVSEPHEMANVNGMQAMLKDLGFQVPDINMKAYMKARAMTQEFIDEFLGYFMDPTNKHMSSLLLKCGLPGGMMGSMMADLKGVHSGINMILRGKNEPELSLDDLLVMLFDEVEYVWPKLGYPPLVTPFSQYVKNVALMNLMQQVKGEERWTMIDNHTWDMILGKSGRLPGTLAPEIVELAKSKGFEFVDTDPQLNYPDALDTYRKEMDENGWEYGDDDEELFELAMHDRQYRDYKSGVAKKRFEDDLQRAKDAAMAKNGYSEEEIKKLKRAKADPIIAPSKGQVLWEVSVEGPSSAPFIGRKYQHDEVFCYISTPWGEYEKIWTGFTGRVVEVCAKQGDVVNKGDVIAYIQRSDIFA